MPDPVLKPNPESYPADNVDELDEEENDDGGGEYDFIEEDEEEEEEDEYDDVLFESTTPRGVRLKMDALVKRMLTGPVSIHVHDVIIEGNTKTKGYIIEAEASEFLKRATTMQELLQASNMVNSRLKSLGLFDSVKITLDSGPPEIPGSAVVIIEVEEAENRFSGAIGAYTKADVEAKPSSVEGSIIYKNLLGYGDLWNGSIAYGFDHSAEVNAGVYLPRFKALVAPVTVRAYFLTQDWLNFSSYKERSVGLSFGLFANKYHNLEYNLAWRNLTDASQISSSTIRSQLGHNLLSSLKHTIKVDRRNSIVRPTRGFAFVSATQIGGLAPDSQSLRFMRQEFDLRCAIPLGFHNAALNFGISSGLIIPWGKGFLNNTTSPERFFLGGNLSPVCALGGPKALWGFKSRGVGSYELSRQVNDENSDAIRKDFLGGDVAVTAMADLSFDIPSRWFREKGIHAHVFGCAGNVAKLTEHEYRSFSVQKFLESFRSSVGVGIVIPSSLFRMELNYCYILKKFDNDRAKAGFWLTVSRPS